jgi:nucleotide-binding universal stress UspA family protein
MRLLIATGGSPHSEVALRLGAQIARHAGVTPTILTVIRNETNRLRANPILAHACEILKPAIPEVQTKVRLGAPAEEIIHEAEEGHYDLIIVGERRDHDLITRLLGSTAKRVVEQAPCPVIIAKGKVGPIRHILLCDSGAASLSLLNRFTARLAALIDGEVQVTVLHVMSQMTAGPGVRGKQLRASAEELIQEHTPEGELLERDMEILEQLNLRAQPKIRHGLVVDEILEEARSGNYDLVVIGAHRGAGWERFLLDDLAYQIIEQMNHPVLVVR